MKPCWIEVTILTSGEKELRNLAVFETIRTGKELKNRNMEGRQMRAGARDARADMGENTGGEQMNATKARAAVIFFLAGG